MAYVVTPGAEAGEKGNREIGEQGKGGKGEEGKVEL